MEQTSLAKKNIYLNNTWFLQWKLALNEKERS